MVNKILFITLSNIGDAVLTLPALDYLRHNFPAASITVITAARPREIFSDNPALERVIVYDKHSRLKDKINLFRQLSRQSFDMVIDLRNSFFGALMPASYQTSPFTVIPKEIKHMRDRHLYKVAKSQSHQVTSGPAQKFSLNIAKEDEEYINRILKENNIKEDDKIIVVAAGARSHIKRWAEEKFVDLISSLVREFSCRIILVGDKEDAAVNKYIADHFYSGDTQLNSTKTDSAKIKYCVPVLDLTGRTNLSELAGLLKKAHLLIANDSAVLHIGSYLNVPIVAIFGPTNEKKYGPWSNISVAVRKEIACRPCEKAQCRFGSLECMHLIRAEDVLRQARSILGQETADNGQGIKKDYKRILVVRTDRIGDVVLSTPVIKALRDEYPHSYIAMMVTPYAKDVIEENPYLDQVIIYDKAAKHKSWGRSLKFASRLKKKKFDLAIILHPTARVHLVIFLAAIPRRIGYNRKMGFLLTGRLEHAKQLGEKHELEYNLDLLRYVGITAKDSGLLIPLRPDIEVWVKELFRAEGIDAKQRLLAIHPAASCPSKVWPAERFAECADKLAQVHGIKVVMVAGPKDMALAQKVAANMRSKAINLAGKTSVSQLAGILKRCSLFISNDSGPVHIASAVGTPVISIFGRNQKGLSPKRWGPVGKKDKFLHKEVGCIECLAHNCKKDFACLKAITVDDIIAAAEEVLKQ